MNIETNELLIDIMTIIKGMEADYLRARKSTYDFEEKQIYAEGEAALQNLRYRIGKLVKERNA